MHEQIPSNESSKEILINRIKEEGLTEELLQKYAEWVEELNPERTGDNSPQAQINVAIEKGKLLYDAVLYSEAMTEFNVAYQMSEQLSEKDYLPQLSDELTKLYDAAEHASLDALEEN